MGCGVMGTNARTTFDVNLKMYFITDLQGSFNMDLMDDAFIGRTLGISDRSIAPFKFQGSGVADLASPLSIKRCAVDEKRTLTRQT